MQAYSANKGLAYSVMPQMMIAAPTIFIVVIATPNTKCASISPNTTPRAFEHVGQAHVHPLDNLLPQHRVDAEHAHRAGEERDVPRRKELPLRRKLREHPRRGVYEECADQGDVFKDREHLSGNIEFPEKYFCHTLLTKYSRGIIFYSEQMF